MAPNKNSKTPFQASAVDATETDAPADAPREDLKPAEVPPAAEGESPLEAAQPDSVSHRLIESNLEAEPSVVKPEDTDPAPPPDKTGTDVPHPAEKIFRDAEEQLQDLLDSGVDRSDIELVTDSVGRLIEARRIQL